MGYPLGNATATTGLRGPAAMDRKDSDNVIDRRRFLRHAAAIAWMTPTILTLTASHAAATHSGCVHLGSTGCVSPASCCTAPSANVTCQGGRCCVPTGFPPEGPASNCCSGNVSLISGNCANLI